MINEGRGISNLNKIETDNIFKIFEKNGFSSFDHQILNRVMKITFEIGNYDSKFYKNHGVYYLLVTCPENYDDLKLKCIITHELTHFIEVSRIEDKRYTYPNYNNIKKSLIEFNTNDRSLVFFKHLIYKSLDNEINANVSQTYTYLKNFNSIDINFLKTKLEEYPIRKEYKDLFNFNINKFKNDLKDNNLNLDEFNNILIKNNVGDFLDFVKNKREDDLYIDRWVKVIKSNISKLLSKQDNIIKEFIEDQNYSTDLPLSENLIMGYKEYLKENLNNNNES